MRATSTRNNRRSANCSANHRKSKSALQTEFPTFQHPGDRSRFLAGIASQLAYNELDFISLIATSILVSLSQKRGISIDWHRSESNLGCSTCSLDSHRCQLSLTIFPHVDTASSKRQTTFAPASHTILGIATLRAKLGTRG